LRDAASAILALFAPDEAREGPAGAGATDTAPPRGPAARPKSPLEVRIDRHSGTIQRALTVVARLNPEGKSEGELPEDVRAAIARHERGAREVIDAEVHFWSATVENNPIIRLDPTEAAWVRRLLELADRVGCSPGYEEHLSFLHNWDANARH
jgi:hypothetical protein